MQKDPKPARISLVVSMKKTKEIGLFLKRFAVKMGSPSAKNPRPTERGLVERSFSQKELKPYGQGPEQAGKGSCAQHLKPKEKSPSSSNCARTNNFLLEPRRKVTVGHQITICHTRRLSSQISQSCGVAKGSQRDCNPTQKAASQAS